MITQWLSELGHTRELQSLLEGIDKEHGLVWEYGGCRYQRDDRIVNEKGEWSRVDPFSGNAAIGYARLNVPDGENKMWEQPWAREHIKKSPYVDGLQFDQGVDCLRGEWYEEMGAMVVTLKSLRTIKVSFTVQNSRQGVYGIYWAGELVEATEVAMKGSINVEHGFAGGEEVDTVVWRGE